MQKTTNKKTKTTNTKTQNYTSLINSHSIKTHISQELESHEFPILQHAGQLECGSEQNMLSCCHLAIPPSCRWCFSSWAKSEVCAQLNGTSLLLDTL